MTVLLEKVMNRIKELSDDEQDLLASYILEKLESDWDENIKKDFASNGSLYWILEEAKLELKNGNTILGGFDGN
jgi:hypothetical protein